MFLTNSGEYRQWVLNSNVELAGSLHVIILFDTSHQILLVEDVVLDELQTARFTGGKETIKVVCQHCRETLHHTPERALHK